MNKGFTFVAAIALTSLFAVSIVDAGTFQKSKSKSKSKPKSSSSRVVSGPETGLLGVKLYDSGLRVISLYGNPDSITAVGGSTTTAPGAGAPPGGFGGPSSAGAAGGPPRGGNAGGGSQQSAAPFIPSGLVPGAFGDPVPDMQRGGPAGGGNMSAPSAPPGQGGPTSAGAGPSGGGPSGPAGAGGGAGGGGATESAVFTRWTYNRNGSKLGFVLDKFDRVVQIEAIGLQNQRVKTRRGVGFGSSFSSVMKAYAPSNDPDGYDISGNNFTIRFLTRNRVAFRLTQLSNKKAHVVTGIVVAAGKQ